MRCRIFDFGGALWIENNRTTGFGAASIAIADAEANAEVDVSAGDVRVEESDTENALLAVDVAAELVGILFISCLRDFAAQLQAWRKRKPPFYL
jgi:hypothetical protein